MLSSCWRRTRPPPSLVQAARRPPPGAHAGRLRARVCVYACVPAAAVRPAARMSQDGCCGSGGSGWLGRGGAPTPLLPPAAPAALCRQGSMQRKQGWDLKALRVELPPAPGECLPAQGCTLCYAVVCHAVPACGYWHAHVSCWCLPGASGPSCPTPVHELSCWCIALVPLMANIAEGTFPRHSKGRQRQPLCSEKWQPPRGEKGRRCSRFSAQSLPTCAVPQRGCPATGATSAWSRQAAARWQQGRRASPAPSRSGPPRRYGGLCWLAAIVVRVCVSLRVCAAGARLQLAGLGGLGFAGQLARPTQCARPPARPGTA